MLETKENIYLLFYNVFGMAIISADKITVSVNGYSSRDSSQVHSRRLTQELEDEMKMLDRPIAIPFGAWVDENETRLTTGKLDPYDEEIYQLNKDRIDELIKSALAPFKGSIRTR